MSKHWCQAEIIRQGQHFWGSPWDRPLADPIPPELLERHPDTLTDWDNCQSCGRPMCGKPAPFRLWSDDGEPDIWLCADHCDQQRESQLPVWHICVEAE